MPKDYSKPEQVVTMKSQNIARIKTAHRMLYKIMGELVERGLRNEDCCDPMVEGATLTVYAANNLHEAAASLERVAAACKFKIPNSLPAVPKKEST